MHPGSIERETSGMKQIKGKLWIGTSANISPNAGHYGIEQLND